jgi:UDP-N-acetylmuramoyl-L-alanyl-D-glutamate--2,6-diaminopimelate ligase
MTSETTRPAAGDWRHGLPEGVAREELPAVRRIQFDSREVGAGDLFVAIEGQHVDGHDFAAPAVASGAAALVVERGRAAALSSLDVPIVEVRDAREALASIAAAHEGYPGRELGTIGVTGTDGKTTTSFLTAAGLEGCGLTVGLLTTVETRVGGEARKNPTRLTSQEAPYVQRLLRDMVDAGCSHAVVEATSIGLEWHRVAHCYFDVGVMTNLGADHLDFHGSVESYRDAKARLFASLVQEHGQGQRTAVLNADDPNWEYFASRTGAGARVVTYGVESPSADVIADDLSLWPDGSTFTLTAGEDTIDASVRLPGRFNVANATAAITAGAAFGLDVMAVAAGVATSPGVPGRMERIRGAPFEVIVDYAHTADGLRQAIGALRPLVEGRIIVVFGCAGERGRERRAGMGMTAADLADFAVLTEEDPRSESSEAIIAEIAQAMLDAGAHEGERFDRVPDRREAVAHAFELARPGDIVLLAGKGHESTIERAEGAVPWDEREVARELIAERFDSDAPPI